MRDIEEIKNKANYCLTCKSAKCIEGCPIHTNIPEFISKIKENRIEEAYNILQENNPLSSICSRVCYQNNQCQRKCIRAIKGESVHIGELEQFVNDWAKENNITYKPVKKANKEKGIFKVAIIGSGPSGLTCGYEMNKQGYDVTIFEKEKELGGILRYGIPDFRLPKHLVNEIIDKLKESGIKFETEKELGLDISIDSLKKEGFNAIFVGIGARNSDTYKLTEKDSNRIYTSKYFLKRYNEKSDKINDLGITVVVGGGNVAIDCARTAIKMGASESYILYRRNKESMPATEEELYSAIKDGVGLIYLTKINTFDEKTRTIGCNKIKIEEGKVIDVPDSNFTMKADNVVFAIGLSPDEKLLNDMNLKVENRILYTNENGMTNIEGVFAGGDVMQKKATVVKAISAGKTAAKGIIEWRKESIG